MDAEVSRIKFQKEIDAIKGEASEFVTRRGWQMISTHYPAIRVVWQHPKSGRKVGFQFTCDEWDEVPPSLLLFDPETGEELAWERWPKGGWSVGNPHPVTGKPFLCLPGIREYHTHSSHLDAHWANYRCRESYKLRYIMDRVRQRFGDTNG